MAGSSTGQRTFKLSSQKNCKLRSSFSFLILRVSLSSVIFTEFMLSSRSFHWVYAEFKKFSLGLC